MSHKQRLFKTNIKDNQMEATYRQILNKYYEKVKKAKNDHWNSFLEKEDPGSIYKAMAYTIDPRNTRIPAIRAADYSLREGFQEKCQVFRSTLFPILPTTENPVWDNYVADTWEWQKLTVTELERACSKEIKGKNSGPDEIPPQLVTQAYQAIPQVFSIFSLLYLTQGITLDAGNRPRELFCANQESQIIPNLKSFV